MNECDNEMKDDNNIILNDPIIIAILLPNWYIHIVIDSKSK